MFLLVASLVEFVSASDLCGWSLVPCTSRTAWALSCGLISSLVCGVHIYFVFSKPDLAAMTARYFSIFLSVWWILGLSFITSSKGFTFHVEIFNLFIYLFVFIYFFIYVVIFIDCDCFYDRTLLILVLVR